MRTFVFPSKYGGSWVLPVLISLALPLTFSAARAADANENRGQFSASDYKFAKAAACGGNFEVTLGKIASERSTNSSVQQFGQRMMTDHGKAGQDLQQIATRNGATLPSEPSSEQQKDIDKLNKLTGPDFDKEYVSLMVKAHKEDAKEFKKASEKVENADLKAFATTTLAIVEEHLKMAEDLEQSLKRLASR